MMFFWVLVVFAGGYDERHQILVEFGTCAIERSHKCLMVEVGLMGKVATNFDMDRSEALNVASEDRSKLEIFFAAFLQLSKNRGFKLSLADQFLQGDTRNDAKAESLVRGILVFPARGPLDSMDWQGPVLSVVPQRLGDSVLEVLVVLSRTEGSYVRPLT